MKMEISLSQSLTINRKHIYKSPVVANHYDKSFVRSVPLEDFNRWVNSILSTHLSSTQTSINIFEGGIGTGFFSIPTIEYMNKIGQKGYFYGIDNSDAMLNVLFKKDTLKKLQTDYADKIALGYGDLEKKLYLPNFFFDISILAGIFHCLYDINSALTNVINILKKNGYLILVLKTDDYTKIQSGQKLDNSEINESYSAFWNYYYNIREKNGIALDPRYCFVFDTDKVKDEVAKHTNGKLAYLETIKFSWNTVASFNAMTQAIKYGSSFALGQGVPNRIKKELTQIMSKWLSTNHLMKENTQIEHQMEALVWKRIA